MKKNSLKKNILPLAITFLFIGGIAWASWSEPVDTPTAYNRPVPVHEGPTQVKNGGLTVGGVFTAEKSATFYQDTAFSGIIRGGSPLSSSSTVYIGGKNSTGTTVTQDFSVKGPVSAKGAVKVGCVADDNNTCGATDNNTNELCATPTGKIVFCDSSDSNPQDCPDGTIHTAPNGDCGYTVIVDGSGYTGMNITAVSGIKGYTFDGPVGSTSSKRIDNGLHDEMTSATGFSVTISGISFGNGHVALTKTGFLVDCQNIAQNASSTTKYFPATFYDATDVIRISGDLGDCPL